MKLKWNKFDINDKIFAKEGLILQDKLLIESTHVLVAFFYIVFTYPTIDTRLAFYFRRFRDR